MIVIIDYGMGNLKSVYNALKKLDIPCMISSNIEDINNALALILPGVGAFPDAMDNLNKYNLVSVIRKKVSEGCPLLGICLGMQMLFEKGYEGAEKEGLGFIKGTVKLMEPVETMETIETVKKVKVPHIGWNRLEIVQDNPLLNNLKEESFVYYVHSYCATGVSEEDLVAYSEYGGMHLTGLVSKGNVMGAQFHPEKSGEVGLEILRNFWEMVK